MGECVVACISSTDGEPCNSDGLANFNVLVGECCSGTVVIQSDGVVSFYAGECRRGLNEKCGCCGCCVVGAVVGGDAGDGDGFGGDVGRGGWLGE